MVLELLQNAIHSQNTPVKDNYKSKAKLPVVVVTTIQDKVLKILQTLSNWRKKICHLRNEGGLSPSPRKVHTKNDRVFPIKKNI